MEAVEQNSFDQADDRLLCCGQMVDHLAASPRPEHAEALTQTQVLKFLVSGMRACPRHSAIAAQSIILGILSLLQLEEGPRLEVAADYFTSADSDLSASLAAAMDAYGNERSVLVPGVWLTTLLDTAVVS